MRPKKPIRASIDQVRITREGKSATVEHADASIATTHLTIGDEIASMSDAVKGFGCRPITTPAARTGAGVGKPPVKEPAGY